MATKAVTPVPLETLEDLKHEIGKVRVSELVIDKRVQRTKLNPRKINKMVAEFDRNALGVVIVSRRPNGTYIALDGWHRTEVCKLVRDAPAELDAIIFDDLTLAQEARLFRLYNFRSTVHTADTFRAEAHEGDETAVQITEMVESYGLEIGPNGFAAVATAKRVTERPNGLEIFKRTLAILDRAYTLDRASSDWRIVEGIAEMIYHYETPAFKFDDEGFATRLARKENDLSSLIRQARALHKSLERGRFVTAMVITLLPVYNFNVRDAKRLPPYQRATAGKLKEPQTEA